MKHWPDKRVQADASPRTGIGAILVMQHTSNLKALQESRGARRLAGTLDAKKLWMSIRDDIKALAAKYASELEYQVDARVAEVKADDTSHYLVFV